MGPLDGVRVIEFAGLGPAPFCGMLLSDLGADVVRIDRAEGKDYQVEDVESRGRRSIVLDLKNDSDKQLALKLCSKAQILIEGFRPGVMERLELGPEDLLSKNPALVYGRITGWGQTGPLAQKAGHDLNYLAITGALHALGSKEKPAVPLNLLADFGGGAMYLMMGMLSALYHAKSTGQGQVIDSAMTEGVISMLNMIYGDLSTGAWQDKRESNVIDGAAPFYNVYLCADDKWLSFAAIEHKFFQQFLILTQLNENELFEKQWEKTLWPQMSEVLQSLFKTKDRDEWIDFFSNFDVCIAPVLSLEEAQNFSHNESRQSFQTIDGVKQAAALPKMSETPAKTPLGVSLKNQHREEILQNWDIE